MVSSRSLLLVDADPGVHHLLATLPKHEDRCIHAVADGREALERLRVSAFDLVLAGQGRNGLEGVKLLRKMRAVRPEARVIVTGEASATRAIRAIRAHAYSYVHKPLAPGPLAEIVQQALDAPPWHDDLKVISARPEWITLDVRCKLAAADRTTYLLRELEADLPPEAIDDLAAAFRELLLNAIEHGGRSDPRKRVRVSLMRTSRARMVHMRDPGKGFSLEAISHAAVCNPEDSPTRHIEIREEQGQRPGGFGILMARNLVDELLYNERGNEVMFVKYVRPQHP